MELKVTNELLKQLARENMPLMAWVFLLSLQQEQEKLFNDEDVEVYAFIAQNLIVLGLVEMCSDDTDNLYCITQKGLEVIDKLKAL